MAEKPKKRRNPSVQVRVPREIYDAIVTQATRLDLSLTQVLSKAWRLAEPEIRKAPP